MLSACLQYQFYQPRSRRQYGSSRVAASYQHQLVPSLLCPPHPQTYQVSAPPPLSAPAPGVPRYPAVEDTRQLAADGRGEYGVHPSTRARDGTGS